MTRRTGQGRQPQEAYPRDFDRCSSIEWTPKMPIKRNRYKHKRYKHKRYKPKRAKST